MSSRSRRESPRPASKVCGPTRDFRDFAFSIHHFTMPRASLTPISGNRSRKIELAPYECGMIVEALTLGHTPTEIGKALHFTKSTVQPTIQRQSERKNSVSKSRSG